jgi:hypothetical protein
VTGGEGGGGRRPEELQHKDDGGRRRLEDHNGRLSGTELQHEDGDAAPAKRSGEESGNGRRGEPSLLRKHFLPFFSLRGKENEAQLCRLS